MTDHYHGEYAEQRHDHDNDYAPLHHRHYDLEREDESLRRELRELRAALGEFERYLADARGRIRQLEAAGHEADVQRENRDLREAAEDDAWGGKGPSASYEDWLAEGQQAEQPEGGQPPDTCPETSDGYHCTHWQEGTSSCCACGSEPDEDQAAEPEPEECDPGPEIADEGGMSEYRYVRSEDYQRGQS